VATDKIHDLLILQDRNTTVQQLKADIDRLPTEIDKLKQKILEEQQSLEDAKKSLKSLERRRKDLELEVESAETQIHKYKTQQLSVKKNDEYRALTQQIEQVESKIGDLETQELMLMEEIDAANELSKNVAIEVDKKVAYQQGLIRECEEKLEMLRSRLGDAEQDYRIQISKMDALEVALFENFSKQIKRPPYIAELSGQNCGGCHMRVSNDVYKQAKMGELARCDQCARLVYIG